MDPKTEKDRKDHIVGIVGCRHFNNYILFKEKIQQWEQDHGTIKRIVSGGATGADHLAEQYGKDFQKELVIYKADWNKYGRKAGPLRNSLIVDNIDRLIAFPSEQSRGTWDSVTKARLAQKEVTIYRI